MFAGSVKTFIIVLLLISEISFGQSLEEANLLMMQENYKEALLRLNVILEADSSNIQVLYRIGICNLGLNDYLSAINTLEYTALKDPKNIPVLLSLAKAYKNAGNYLKAKDIYKRIIENDSLNLSASVNLASLYLDLQNYSSAGEIYKKLCGLDSSNSYYLKQTGWCLYKLENLTSATEYYEKALHTNRYDLDAALDLSLIFFKMEKLDSAYMTVLNVYGTYGDDARINKMLGDIQMKRKDFTDAEKYYKLTLQNGDSSAVIFQKIGITIYMDNTIKKSEDSEHSHQRFTESKEFLEKSYNKNNKDVLTNLYLGLAYKHLGNYPEAVKFLENAVKLSIPSYMSEVCNDLAFVYECNMEYQKALETYAEALKYEPESKTNLYHMAIIYDLRLSQRKTAAKFYRKYIDWPRADKLLKAYAEKRIESLK